METLIDQNIAETVPPVETEDWDLVIEPKAGLFVLNLKEVWRYRDLLLLFVRRDLTAQYKQTILGPLWHFLQPLFTTVIFLLVFRHFAGIPTDGIEPVLFYMSGLTIWNYFASCLITTSNTFIANAGIFGKVYFPRLVTPLSIILSNIVRLSIQLGLLALAIIYFALVKHVSPNIGLHLVLLPFLIVMMAGLGLGLGIIISSLTTKYRDLNVLIGFGVQLLMYTTPVAYPMSFLKNKSFASLIEWNPLSPVVESFRYGLFGTGNFQPLALSFSLLFMMTTLVMGALLFSKVEKTFMDTV